MMKRKLISQGMNGFTITLPVSWIREHNLQAGNEIELNLVEEGIMLSSKIIKRERTIEIDVSEYDERMIINLLNQVYRLGYDIIRVKFKEKEHFQAINQLVKDTLLGFEIVEHKEELCIIQNIAEPEDEKFDIILRKVFLMIMEMGGNVHKQLSENSYKESSIQEIDDLKLQIDKLNNYLRRTIMRTRKGGNRSYLLWSIIFQLSLISHAYYYLYKYALEKKEEKIKRTKSVQDILKLISSTNTMFRRFYVAFYNKDIKEMYEIGLLKKELLYKKAYGLFEKSKNVENVLIHHTAEIIRLIHMCTPSAIGYMM